MKFTAIKQILAVFCILHATHIFAQILEEDDDLNLDDSEAVTNVPLATKPSDSAATTQVPQPLTISGGTIKIICNKDNARVTINSMELGKTPFCRNGFQPGFYNIELHHEQCHPFSKMVLLEKNDTLLIDAQLVEIGERFTPAPEANITVAPPANNSIQTIITENKVPITVTEPKRERGTLVITCSVPEATVFVNKVSLGKTPITKNGLPGYYEVDVKCNGYKPFYKMVQLKGNDTISVQADLISELSRIVITSTPTNANILLNNKKVGVTPFDSAQITPSTYNLRIELPEYVAFKKTLTLSASSTDTISVVLKTVVFCDSVKKVRAHRFKVFRRTFFGICTAGSVGGVLAFNYKADENLTDEKKAYDSYMQPGLSGYEYDTRYQNYQDAVVETDKNLRARKAFTILSAIGAAGLTISIPF